MHDTSTAGRFRCFNWWECGHYMVERGLPVTRLRLYNQLYKDSAPAEEAIRTLGYTETGGTYRHTTNYFTLEFPPGPLAIGNDLVESWETLYKGDLLLHVLSPTDSCRDRLAGFYYWRDFSSLKAAVEIALKNQLMMEEIKSWSEREGSSDRFAEFERALAQARSNQARH